MHSRRVIPPAAVASCGVLQVVRLQGSSVATAMTCKQNGGLLRLPEYDSREALREGLAKSMAWSEGYAK